MGEPYVHSLRVRYAECDLQGVVFNAHYMAYFDISITELWRAAFGSYGAMLARGVDMVVAEAQLRFRTPARFDDELKLEVGISRLGNTSIISRHRAICNGELAAEGMIRHVMVQEGTLSKTSIPDWVRGALAPWIVEQAASSAEER